MVLQRGEGARVWGWVSLGCSVALAVEEEAGGGVFAARAPLQWGEVELDGRGLWVATLPEQRGGLATYRVSVFSSAGDRVVLGSVQFGEVLACLGQSNIARSTVGSVGAMLGLSPELMVATAELRAELEATPLPVRYLGLSPADTIYPDLWHKGAPGLQDFPRPIGLPWIDASTLSPAVLENTSSVCWLWGREVAARLGGSVPVGLVEGAVGGSVIQAWSAPAALAACSAPPAAPNDFASWAPGGPSALHNVILSPLQVGPLALGGLAWYNGESNSLFQQGDYYACALPRLLEDLRKGFGKPLLWVAVVELHPFFIYDVSSVPTAQVRAAQVAAASGALRVSLVPAVDLGDSVNNLHPLGLAKLGVAQRLGLAFMRAREQGVFEMGPRYEGAEALLGEGEGCSLRVAVRLVAASVDGGGLEVRDPSRDSVSTRCPTESLSEVFCDGFGIQDREGVWHKASARTSARSAREVELWVEDCKSGLSPVATRNGWGGWPIVLLYDLAGFPAHPWPPTPLEK